MKTILIKVIWPGESFESKDWTPWKRKNSEDGDSVSQCALLKAMREAGYCAKNCPYFDPKDIVVYSHDPAVDPVHRNGKPFKIHVTTYRLTSTKAREEAFA